MLSLLLGFWLEISLCHHLPHVLLNKMWNISHDGLKEILKAKPPNFSSKLRDFLQKNLIFMGYMHAEDHVLMTEKWKNNIKSSNK